MYILLQECATPTMGLYGSMLHTCCSLTGQDKVGTCVVYLAFHSGIVYNDIKDIRVIADKSEMQAFLVKLQSHTTHETSCHEAVVCSCLLLNYSWYFHEKYSSGCIENTKQPSFAEKGGTKDLTAIYFTETLLTNILQCFTVCTYHSVIHFTVLGTEITDTMSQSYTTGGHDYL